MTIQSVYDESFRAYGRVFPDFAASRLVEAMHRTDAPTDGAVLPIGGKTGKTPGCPKGEKQLLRGAGDANRVLQRNQPEMERGRALPLFGVWRCGIRFNFVLRKMRPAV